MNKVIERPMSKTYITEFLFHYIKDETEMKNVIAANPGKEIFQVMRIVDVNTFQPMLYFAFEEKNKLFSEWMKYVVKMELMIKEK